MTALQQLIRKIPKVKTEKIENFMIEIISFFKLIVLFFWI